MAKNLLCILALILCLCFTIIGYAWSWDNEQTHRDISRIAGEQSALSKIRGDFLGNLGFSKGMLEEFGLGGIRRTVGDWLREGADLEDAGNNWQAINGQARFNNHFFNPLKPWGSAGLNDVIVKTIPNITPPFIPQFITVAYPVTGEAAIKWAQDSTMQETALEGNWTWDKARTFYYTALTSKTDKERQAYFARTFRGLGQQMHLLQDMAVPAHVRNDGHPEETVQDMLLKKKLPAGDLYFEMWAKYNTSAINNMARQPKEPMVDLSKNPGGLNPITQFYDTDNYAEGKSPDTIQTWGLAEYSNSNFMSHDTIFTENFSRNDRHYFPYPRYDPLCYRIVTSVDTVTYKLKRYLNKNCQGEKITHFAAAGPLFPYLWPHYRGALKLDETTHREYSEHLIPRAVGYSAALLDYFFRGDIRLEYTITPRPGFVIKNKTDENMDGLFQVLYDNKNDQRVKIMSGNFSLGKQSAGAVFDITHPIDAKEPGKYIIAFRGTMGNEKEAVAGYVTTRLLEITPPAQFIYSMTDGSGADPYFRNIRAKVKNASLGEQMKTGTILAVAKYKLDTADPVFLYSISDPQPIDLSSGDPAELNFDFDNDPIPLDVTDLYLEVVFKGAIGSETDAIASGIKDISEPTPIDIFNDTDKSCINGVWYPAADAIDLMDTHWPKDHIADTWDVNPHLLKDIYIKLSPMTNPVMASSTVYNSMVQFLYPGEFRQAMYMLSDYRFKYSFHETWSGAPGYTDYGQHGIRVSTYEGTAVTNQTDYTSDPATCGRNLLCSIYRYPVYYSLRNYQMWWGGGLVYINWPYPYNSSCQGF